MGAGSRAVARQLGDCQGRLLQTKELVSAGQLTGNQEQVSSGPPRD